MTAYGNILYDNGHSFIVYDRKRVSCQMSLANINNKGDINNRLSSNVTFVTVFSRYYYGKRYHRELFEIKTNLMTIEEHTSKPTNY